MSEKIRHHSKKPKKNSFEFIGVLERIVNATVRYDDMDDNDIITYEESYKHILKCSTKPRILPNHQTEPNWDKVTEPNHTKPNLYRTMYYRNSTFWSVSHGCSANTSDNRNELNSLVEHYFANPAVLCYVHENKSTY